MAKVMKELNEQELGNVSGGRQEAQCVSGTCSKCREKSLLLSKFGNEYLCEKCSTEQVLGSSVPTMPLKR